MKPLIHSMVADPDLISILGGLKSGMREQLVAGLSGSARQAAIAAMYRELKRPMLIITHNMFSAQKMADDLQECLSAEEVLHLPRERADRGRDSHFESGDLGQTIRSFDEASKASAGSLSCHLQACGDFSPIAISMAEARIDMQVGQTLPMEPFLRDMIEMGYERVDRVEQKGH